MRRSNYAVSSYSWRVFKKSCFYRGATGVEMGRESTGDIGCDMGGDVGQTALRKLKTIAPFLGLLFLLLERPMIVLSLGNPPAFPVFR